MCSQVLLFGRHTWGGRRDGGSNKGQSADVLGQEEGEREREREREGRAVFEL